MKTIVEIFNSVIPKPMCSLKGLDLYSVVAKEYHNLQCDVKDVRQLYPQERTNVKMALYREIYK